METPSLGPILAATIVTPDMERSVRAWEDHLYHRVLAREHISLRQSRYWGVSELAGARVVWLANEEGEGWLRLIEARDAEVVDPFRHRGWMSLEINVQDVDSLGAELQNSPFEIIGEPANLDVSDDIRAMQVIGPAGEVLYLTEVKAEVPPFELPFARCAVDRLFIPVMLADDRDDALEIYERFPGVSGLKFETKITVINRARGLEVEQKHPVSTIQLSGANLIEIDQLAGLEDRPLSCVGLPAGIAFITFSASAIPDSLQPGRGSTLIQGAGGERFELILDKE